MMLDINNVFRRTAPAYLRLMGGLLAGLIGGSFPLLMDGPAIMAPKMLIGTGMLVIGMLLLFWAMYLGARNLKKPRHSEM